MRRLLAGFKDPIRRPRFIIWLGTVVLALAAGVVLILGAVSSRWFCATMCHKVQDDAMIAYSHSSHAKVSCFACHVPVNAGTHTLIYYKLKDMMGVIPTVRNTYELPLNAESELALNKKEMPEEKCTQCHDLAHRKITPSAGIIINHDVHSKAGYQCTVCHNRIAHNEDFDLTLPGNTKHADFMKMDACFRCHGLQPGAKAPGECVACHPKDFNLKPRYHLQADFYPTGHAKLALLAEETVAAAEAAEKEAAKQQSGSEEKADIPAMGTVDTCTTCHVKATFCDKCHGMDMPHSAAFKEPKSADDPAGHPVFSKAEATSAKCEFCHHQSKTSFCDDCHHGSYVKWMFDSKTPWRQQHAAAVTRNGADGCLGKCHDTKSCSDCHNRLKPIPTSHKNNSWLHGPSLKLSSPSQSVEKRLAGHAVSFQKPGGPSACAVCHGDGGTKAAFCKGCHKLDMPHPVGFGPGEVKPTKDNGGDHAKDFQADPPKWPRGQNGSVAGVCVNCHTQPFCDSCHHKDGFRGRAPWGVPRVGAVQEHPAQVRAKGAEACMGCHQEAYCSHCHVSSR
ncbi:MAG TPA: cytochrome c3 family protein [Coriobacteriia bacterium]|jgi:hypothetical protein